MKILATDESLLTWILVLSLFGIGGIGLDGDSKLFPFCFSEIFFLGRFGLILMEVGEIGRWYDDDNEIPNEMRWWLIVNEMRILKIGFKEKVEVLKMI